MQLGIILCEALSHEILCQMWSKKFRWWKNLPYYPTQNEKSVILVKTGISEHCAWSCHYADIKSLCDEEIGLGLGWETVLFLLDIRKLLIYNIVFYSKSLVSVMISIPPRWQLLLFLKKTDNAGHRLRTELLFSCNWKYVSINTILSHCGIAPVKSVQSHDQNETRFYLRELSYFMPILYICLTGWMVCVRRNLTLRVRIVSSC